MDEAQSYNGFLEELGALESQRKLMGDVLSQAQAARSAMQASIANVPGAGAVVASDELTSVTEADDASFSLPSPTAANAPTRRQSVAGGVRSTSSLDVVSPVVYDPYAWKGAIETAFHCMAGTNANTMTDLMFYHFCYHAGIASRFPEDTDQVAYVNRHKQTTKLPPFVCRSIFSFVTQGSSTLNVPAFFLALVHCAHMQLKFENSLDEENRQDSNTDSMLLEGSSSHLSSGGTVGTLRGGSETLTTVFNARLRRIYTTTVHSFVKIHATSFPFPDRYFHDTMCVARVLWKFSEGLENVYDRYVPENHEMSLGEFETCFSEFGVIPQVNLQTMHRLFFIAAQGGNNKAMLKHKDEQDQSTLSPTKSADISAKLQHQQHQDSTLSFDQFLEVIARIACEVLSDDTYSRWLTLDAKLQHFLASVFGSAYSTIFGRPMPREDQEPSHPFVADVCDPISGSVITADQGISVEEATTIAIRGRYFGAIGRGVWLYDSASDVVQHIPVVLSDEFFEMTVRASPSLVWTNAEITMVELDTSIKFQVKYTTPFHVAVANAPEDLPFFAPLVSPTKLFLQCDDIVLPFALTTKANELFRTGCRKSSSYNQKNLYDGSWKWLCDAYKMDCGSVNTQALGLEEDPDTVLPMHPAHASLFSKFATRRKNDGGGRASLSFNKFLECLVRIALSHGIPLQDVPTFLEKMMVLRTKPGNPQDAADGNGDDEEQAEDHNQPLSRERTGSGSSGESSTAPPVKGSKIRFAEDTNDGGFGAKPFSSSSGGGGGATKERDRRQTVRDETIMRNIALERKQSVALRNSHMTTKLKLEKVQAELKRWNTIHEEACQGILEIKGFCDMLLSDGADGNSMDPFASTAAADGGGDASLLQQSASPTLGGSRSSANQWTSMSSSSFVAGAMESRAGGGGGNSMRSRAYQQLAKVYKAQLLGVCDRAYNVLQENTIPDDLLTIPATVLAARRGTQQSLGLGSDDDLEALGTKAETQAQQRSDDSDGEKKKSNGTNGAQQPPAAAELFVNREEHQKPCLDMVEIRTQIEQVIRESHQSANAQIKKNETGSALSGAGNRLELLENVARAEDGQRKAKAELEKVTEQLKQQKEESEEEHKKLMTDFETAVDSKTTLERQVAALNTTLKERDKMLSKMKTQMDQNNRKHRSTEDSLELRKEQQQKLEKDIRELKMKLHEASRPAHHGYGGSSTPARRGSMDQSPHQQGRTRSPSLASPNSTRKTSVGAPGDKERVLRDRLNAAERNIEATTTKLKAHEKELETLKAQKERSDNENHYLKHEKKSLEKVLGTVERWSQIDGGDLEFLRNTLSIYREEGEVAKLPTQYERSAGGKRHVTKKKVVKKSSASAVSPRSRTQSFEVSEDSDPIGSTSLEASPREDQQHRSGSAASSSSRTGGKRKKATRGVSRLVGSLGKKGSRKSKPGEASAPAKTKMTRAGSDASQHSLVLSIDGQSSDGEALSEGTQEDGSRRSSGGIIEVDDNGCQTDEVHILDLPKLSEKKTMLDSSSCPQCNMMKLKMRSLRSNLSSLSYQAREVQDKVQMTRHDCKIVMKEFEKSMVQTVHSMKEAVVQVEMQQQAALGRRSSMISNRATPPPSPSNASLNVSQLASRKGSLQLSNSSVGGGKAPPLPPHPAPAVTTVDCNVQTDFTLLDNLIPSPTAPVEAMVVDQPEEVVELVNSVEVVLASNKSGSLTPSADGGTNAPPSPTNAAPTATTRRGPQVDVGSEAAPAKKEEHATGMDESKQKAAQAPKPKPVMVDICLETDPYTSSSEDEEIVVVEEQQEDSQRPAVDEGIQSVARTRIRKTKVVVKNSSTQASFFVERPAPKPQANAAVQTHHVVGSHNVHPAEQHAFTSNARTRAVEKAVALHQQARKAATATAAQSSSSAALSPVMSLTLEQLKELDPEGDLMRRRSSVRIDGNRNEMAEADESEATMALANLGGSDPSAAGGGSSDNHLLLNSPSKKDTSGGPGKKSQHHPSARKIVVERYDNKQMVNRGTKGEEVNIHISTQLTTAAKPRKRSPPHSASDNDDKVAPPHIVQQREDDAYTAQQRKLMKEMDVTRAEKQKEAAALKQHQNRPTAPPMNETQRPATMSPAEQLSGASMTPVPTMANQAAQRTHEERLKQMDEAFAGSAALSKQAPSGGSTNNFMASGTSVATASSGNVVGVSDPEIEGSSSQLPSSSGGNQGSIVVPVPPRRKQHGAAQLMSGSEEVLSAKSVHSPNEASDHDGTTTFMTQQQGGIDNTAQTGVLVVVDKEGNPVGTHDLPPGMRKAIIAKATSKGMAHVLGRNTIPGIEDTHKIDATDQVHFLQENVLYRDEESGQVVTTTRRDWQLANTAEEFLRAPRQGKLKTVVDGERKLVTVHGGVDPEEDYKTLVPSTARGVANRRDEVVGYSTTPRGVGATSSATTGRPTTAPEAMLAGGFAVDDAVNAMMFSVASGSATTTRSGKTLVNVEPLPEPLRPRAPPASSTGGPNSQLPKPSRLHMKQSSGAPEPSTPKGNGQLVTKTAAANITNSRKNNSNLAPIVKAPYEINTRKLRATKQKKIAGGDGVLSDEETTGGFNDTRGSVGGMFSSGMTTPSASNRSIIKRDFQPNNKSAVSPRNVNGGADAGGGGGGRRSSSPRSTTVNKGVRKSSVTRQPSGSRPPSSNGSIESDSRSNSAIFAALRN